MELYVYLGQPTLGQDLESHPTARDEVLSTRAIRCKIHLITRDLITVRGIDNLF